MRGCESWSREGALRALRLSIPLLRLSSRSLPSSRLLFASSTSHPHSHSHFHFHPTSNPPSPGPQHPPFLHSPVLSPPSHTSIHPPVAQHPPFLQLRALSGLVLPGLISTAAVSALRTVSELVLPEPTSTAPVSALPMEVAGRLAAALDRPLCAAGALGSGAAVGAAAGPTLGMGPVPAGGVPAALAAGASAWGPQARRRREASAAVGQGASVGMGPGPASGVPAVVVAAGASAWGPSGRRNGEPRTEPGPRVGAWGSGRSGASILGACIPSQPLPSQPLPSHPLPSQLPPSQPLPSSHPLPTSQSPSLSSTPSPLSHSLPLAHHSNKQRLEAHAHSSAPMHRRSKAAARHTPGAPSLSATPSLSLPARTPASGSSTGGGPRVKTGAGVESEAGAQVVGACAAWGRAVSGAGPGAGTGTGVGFGAGLGQGVGAGAAAGTGAGAGKVGGLGSAPGAWAGVVTGPGSQTRARSSKPHIHGPATQGQGRGSRSRSVSVSARVGASGSVSASVGASGSVEGVGGVESDPKAARKGSLVEFEKDRGKTGLGVIVGTQGKKNWLVMDQFGTSFSVRPQQITFSVLPRPEAGQGSGDPGPSFQAADLVSFVADANRLVDPSLLQMAWEEVLASGTESIMLGALALILFNEAGPVELYACHSMLASDAIFFRQKKGPQISYVPRTSDQVRQLQAKAQAEAEARQQLQAFAQKCRAAMRAEWRDKPLPGEWQRDPYAAPRLRALLAYALERAPEDQLVLAAETLHATGTPSTPAAALELLLALGALPRHVNLSLLQANVPTEFPATVEQVARQLAASPPPDPDKELRVDLTHLKVYMIDSADTVEVDDGLSAEPLPDGRVKVWVHVADPTRWVHLGSLVDMTARTRGTSIYLADRIIPMIPFPLAAGPMSLHYGSECMRRAGGSPAREHAQTAHLGQFESATSTSSSDSRSSSDDSCSSSNGTSSSSRDSSSHSSVFTGSLPAARQEGGAEPGHAWSLPSDAPEDPSNSSRNESRSSFGSAGTSQGGASGMGRQCAMSIGVILRENGSIAEYEIVPSYIHPTYRLTFEEVPEMLAVAAPEESEMGLLVREAQKRRSWRQEQGAIDMYMIEGFPKVRSPDAIDPEIQMDLIDQTDAARQLVSEMMVLCGEVVADFGAARGVPLPYRGQQVAEVSPEAAEVLQSLQGPSLAAHLRLTMNRSNTNCTAPIPHAALGLLGYVQFSSPIRRYGDLLAHYQVKAVLRGETPPLTGGQLHKLMLSVGEAQRAARKVEGSVNKYWVLEYLRRLPMGTPLRAVMLRWVKQDEDRLALVHLTDIGFETMMRLTRKVHLGAEICVVVSEVSPRKAFLRLDEALWAEEEPSSEELHQMTQPRTRRSVPAQPAAAGSRET